MVKVYRSAEPGSTTPDRERMFTRLPELALSKAVFLPADPPRMGRMAFWTPGSEPPDLGV